MNNTPDLILLDIMMPDMDGFEVYHRLRAYEKENSRSETPVIFLTGDNDSETEQKGLKEGAADKITDICLTGTGALMIIDLDSFKLVNDIYGHDMGDKVLAAFAGIMKKNTRSDDVLCRIGGDEFMAFCYNAVKEDAVAAFTRRLNEQLIEEAGRLMGEDFDIPLGVSVGAVFVPEHGTDYGTLFMYMDKALYRVKNRGKHDYWIYDPGEYDEPAENDSPEEELARITKVLEERNETDTAMWLGKDAVTWVYRYIRRMPYNYSRNVVRILFSLFGRNNGRSGVFEEAEKAFGTILQDILCRNDIIMQVRTGRFFVLLTGAGENPTLYAESVADRIIEKWNGSGYYDDIEVRYTLETMIK